MSLRRKQVRAAKIGNYIKSVEIPRIAIDVRLEVRMLRDELRAALRAEPVDLERVSALNAELCRSREVLLDIAGWPKRPGGKVDPGAKLALDITPAGSEIPEMSSGLQDSDHS